MIDAVPLVAFYIRCITLKLLTWYKSAVTIYHSNFTGLVNQTMDLKGPDFILVVFVIFKVTKGQYGVPTEKFVMSIDVSVLESLFLTCFTKNDLRSTLEATVICSDEEGCRAVTRPNHWCECPLEPTLRKWKSNTLWLQARLWKPRIPWRSKHIDIYCLIVYHARNFIERRFNFFFGTDIPPNWTSIYLHHTQ